jgi:hypothetical protein
VLASAVAGYSWSLVAGVGSEKVHSVLRAAAGCVQCLAFGAMSLHAWRWLPGTLRPRRVAQVVVLLCAARLALRAPSTALTVLDLLLALLLSCLDTDRLVTPDSSPATSTSSPLPALLGAGLDEDFEELPPPRSDHRCPPKPGVQMRSPGKKIPTFGAPREPRPFACIDQTGPFLTLFAMDVDANFSLREDAALEDPYEPPEDTPFFSDSCFSD